MQIDFLRKRKYVCAIFVVTPKYISFKRDFTVLNQSAFLVTWKTLVLIFGERLSNTRSSFSFSRQFKRVLELPSENWLELAQDWCCHGNSHLTSVVGVLEPGEKDCFVGEYYIKLHSSTIQPGSLQIFRVSKNNR